VSAARRSKVLRDILERPGRSLLAVLAMALGVFQITAMLYKYALLQPELTTMYDRTQPSSATLITDAATDALIDSVRRVPGVGRAEARPVVVGRARGADGEWVPAVLYVVRDFGAQTLDTLEPEDGAWPPADEALLLERSALEVAGVAVGDSLVLRLPGKDDRRVHVGGTAYAAGLAPAWMEHMVPGFIGWRSPLRAAESAQIRIAVADHALDEGHIREVADSVKTMLERGGHPVSRVTVPPPGRHPHADQMEAFLFLLLAFGVLSFLLSTVLVGGMIHALMAEQLRQVGIMKAIGASTRQVAGIYLAQVGLLAAVALAIGIPAGLVVGRAYADFAAGILNADITRAPFPWWLIAAEIAGGLLVPLLVAMIPVRRAARITVREALADDPPPRAPGGGRLERGIAALPWISRPLALSVRGTFQRRGRFVMTVGGLAVGGAAFLAALNVSAAWTRAVEDDFARRRYDLTASFGATQPIATVEDILREVPSVERTEYWAGASPYLIGPGGVPGSSVTLLGIEPGSTLLDLALVEGRWLAPDGGPGTVINRAVLRLNPELRVGGQVEVRLGARTIGFPIVGIVREMTPMPVVYVPRAALLEATGLPGDRTRSVRIVTREHGDAAERAAGREIEAAFAAHGIEVAGIQRMADMKKGILDHLVIILAILTMASVIVVFVGGLGLASTLALNVVQRTREIGVLGAIGATPRTIARNVWLEGLLFGIAGWGLSLALTVPVSWALGYAAGSIFFKSPLDFYMSPSAVLIWLAVVLAIATACSVLPARRAARMPVRVSLSHA
jgi:putative ABC transport system permease protein